MPDAQKVKAKLAEIASRYRRRRKPVSLAALRVGDLKALYRARYGSSLPDDDAGRDDLKLMAHHLAAMSGNVQKRVAAFVDAWAPWLPVAELKALQVEMITSPQRWRADKLAWRLRLIEADRALLKITTIGAIDMGKAERTKRRIDRARKREQERRAAKGAKPRAEYVASSLASAQPWTAEGISRRTWYRRHRQPVRGTGP
jgi:hypothetical protein